MVGAVKKSKLMAKYGAKAQSAVKAHSNDETKYSGGGDLPGGASGVCQITVCKFDEYKPKTQMAGEMYFMLTGIVKDEFCLIDGIKVRIKGKRVSIIEPLCDTPTKTRKTTDEHIAWILNEFRKLGIDTTGAGAEDLENFAAVITEQKPECNFHVWQPAPATEGKYKGKASNPIHFFDGVVEGSGDEDDGPQVEDNTGSTGDEASGDETESTLSIEELVAAAQDDSDEEARDAAQLELMTRAQAVGKTKEECEDNDTTWEMLGEWITEGEDGDGSSQSVDDMDLDTMGATADEEQEAGDEGECCTKLRELADPLGIEPDSFSTWVEVAEAIKEAQPAEEAEAAEEDINQLGADADEEQSTGEEGEACARLREIAEEQGVNPDDYGDWSSLAEVLAAGATGGDDEWAPEVDEVYGYKATGAKKATEHVVTKVDTDNQTVCLKNLDTDKAVLNIKTKKPQAIAWSELVRSE